MNDDTRQFPPSQPPYAAGRATPGYPPTHTEPQPTGRTPWSTRKHLVIIGAAFGVILVAGCCAIGLAAQDDGTEPVTNASASAHTSAASPPARTPSPVPPRTTAAVVPAPTTSRPRPRTSPTTKRPTAPQTSSRGNCHPSYPTVCIPPPPPDLDCGDITYRRFRVVSPDPHDFDSDHDGIGCES